MTQKPIFTIADLAPQVHERIAADKLAVHPVFGVRQSMRDGGFAADILTIDCRQSGKRILCVFHDQKADTVLKENGFIDKDPEMNFEEIPINSITVDLLYKWVVDYLT